MTIQTGSRPDSVSADELDAMNVWWRAANYLSVGQIYLLANPLLREPLRPEHIKPRLLGHWGTTPGLNFLYVHMNRAIRARGLNAIYVTGPGSRRTWARRERVPRRDLQRGLPAHRSRRGGPAAAVSPVLVPGRDSEPRGARDAGLDPRGRRARVLAAARVRRGARQPGPARAVRGRRRRGRDRPARGELALEQVPEPGARRRRAAGAAPERLQDRQPDGARADPRRRAAGAARGLRLRAAVRRGLGSRGDARPDGGGARRRPRRDRADSAVARATTRPDAAALADDRARRRRRDGPARRMVDGLPVEGTWRAHQVPLAEVRTNPQHLAQLEEWMRSYRPEELFDETGAVVARDHGARARGRGANEREPSHQRRAAGARARAARFPRLRRGGARAGGHDQRGDSRARRLAA